MITITIQWKMSLFPDFFPWAAFSFVQRSSDWLPHPRSACGISPGDYRVPVFGDGFTEKKVRTRHFYFCISWKYSRPYSEKSQHVIFFRSKAMEIAGNYYLQKLIDRRENGSSKVITGLRRAGKSYLLVRR